MCDFLCILLFDVLTVMWVVLIWGGQITTLHCHHWWPKREIFSSALKQGRISGLHSVLPLAQTNRKRWGQELPRCLDGNLEHWTQDTLLSRPNAQYEKEQQKVNAVTEHLNLQTATLAMWQLEAVIYNPNTGVIYSNWADRVQSGGNQRRLHRLNRHQLLRSHPKVLPTSGRQQTLNS